MESSGAVEQINTSEPPPSNEIICVRIKTMDSIEKWVDIEANLKVSDLKLKISEVIIYSLKSFNNNNNNNNGFRNSKCLSWNKDWFFKGSSSRMKLLLKNTKYVL